MANVVVRKNNCNFNFRVAIIFLDDKKTNIDYLRVARKIKTTRETLIDIQKTIKLLGSTYPKSLGQYSCTDQLLRIRQVQCKDDVVRSGTL